MQKIFGKDLVTKVDKEDHRLFKVAIDQGKSLSYDKLSKLKDSKKKIYHNSIWDKAEKIGKDVNKQISRIRQRQYETNLQ